MAQIVANHRPASSRLSRLGVTIVLAHAAVAIVHGASHVGESVLATGWQAAYITMVIWIAPLTAAPLLRRTAVAGFGLLAVAMGGSLVFGMVYHFIVAGPDNVAELPDGPWMLTFQTSAILLAVTEAAGVAIGVMGVLVSIRRS